MDFGKEGWMNRLTFFLIYVCRSSITSIFLQITLSIAEHHSAIVPWQIVAQKTGAILKFLDLNEDEVPDLTKLRGLLSRKTKLVVLHHVSNVLGWYLIDYTSSWGNKLSTVDHLTVLLFVCFLFYSINCSSAWHKLFKYFVMLYNHNDFVRHVRF